MKFKDFQETVTSNSHTFKALFGLKDFQGPGKMDTLFQELWRKFADPNNLIHIALVPSVWLTEAPQRNHYFLKVIFERHKLNKYLKTT